MRGTEAYFVFNSLQVLSALAGLSKQINQSICSGPKYRKCSAKVDMQNHMLNDVISCGFTEQICKQLFSMKNDSLFG